MAITFRPFTIEHYDQAFALWQACEGIGLSDADSQCNIEIPRPNPGAFR